MEQQQLFEEGKSWLEAEKVDLTFHPDDATFDGWMTTTDGLVHVHLH
jgi:hypothetical protein